MQTGQVIVLLASVVVLLGSAVLCVFGGVLLWTARRIAPVDALGAQISGLRAMVEALDAQVTKLRTSKAGTRSNQKRAEQTKSSEELDDDPLLDGLSAEDRALFR